MARPFKRVPSKKDQLDNVLQSLSEGNKLSKVKGGGILYTRNFFVDTKSMKLLYTGSEKRFRKKSTAWSLSSIEEVREGEKDYSKRLDRHDRYKVLCIVFGANHEVLYLMANTYEIRDKWVAGLRYALQLDQYLKQKESSNIWIRQAFDRADKNADNRLDFDEVMKLLKSLNADMDKTYVKDMFNAADTRRAKGEKQATLDREEFVHFYNMMTTRPEIEELFLKYAKDMGHMTATDLQMFLLHEQKEQNVTVERCKELIVVYEPQPECKKSEQLSLIGFRSFLVSQQQHLFNRSHRRVYQDMTQPMTNYFINSSHNTYLAEDQLRGPSRVECYITSLKRGCRCVELDCWDGSDGEPVIYHGYTLTSKILFSDVIRAIKDYAFSTSPYPVTLSIENHCSLEQQAIMAKYMREILEDMLYCPPTLPEQPPSPHELKNKIIVKGKRLPAAQMDQVDGLDDVSDEDESAEANETVHQEKQKKKSKLKLNRNFSAVVGMKSVHFSSTAEIPAGDGNFKVVSLAEKKIGKLLDSELEAVARYTNNMLIRTYPAGTRTDSSNYYPVPMWCGGCQVAALKNRKNTVKEFINDIEWAQGDQTLSHDCTQCIDLPEKPRCDDVTYPDILTELCCTYKDDEKSEDKILSVCTYKDGEKSEDEILSDCTYKDDKNSEEKILSVCTYKDDEKSEDEILSDCTYKDDEKSEDEIVNHCNSKDDGKSEDEVMNDCNSKDDEKSENEIVNYCNSKDDGKSEDEVMNDCNSKDDEKSENEIVNYCTYKDDEKSDDEIMSHCNSKDDGKSEDEVMNDCNSKDDEKSENEIVNYCNSKDDGKSEDEVMNDSNSKDDEKSENEIVNYCSYKDDEKSKDEIMNDCTYKDDEKSDDEIMNDCTYKDDEKSDDEIMNDCTYKDDEKSSEDEILNDCTYKDDKKSEDEILNDCNSKDDEKSDDEIMNDCTFKDDEKGEDEMTDDDSNYDSDYKPDHDTDRVEDSDSESGASDVYPALNRSRVDVNPETIKRTRAFNGSVGEVNPEMAEVSTNAFKYEPPLTRDHPLSPSEIQKCVKYPKIFTKKYDKGSNEKSKTGRKYDTLHACLYCKKLRTNIQTHLLDLHFSKQAVKELKQLQNEEKKCMSDEGKKKIRKIISRKQAILRNKGDNIHNMNVCHFKEGELLISRRREGDFDSQLYGGCPECGQWMILRDNYTKHRKQCPCDSSIPLSSAVVQMMIFKGEIGSSKASPLMAEVFKSIKKDNIGMTAMKNDLIIALGESHFFSSFGNKLKRKNYASFRMRLAARLLILLQKELGNMEATMSECLVVDNFDLIAKCGLKACGRNDDEELKHPSVALKLGDDLNKMVAAKIAFAAKCRDEFERKQGKRFACLLVREWKLKVKKQASVLLQERQFNKKLALPDPEDIAKLATFLIDKLKSVKLNQDIESFRQVVLLTEARLLLYNRRRPGELSDLLISTYRKRSTTINETDLSLRNELTQLEQYLLKSQDLLEMRGKCGNKIPLLLPAEVLQPLRYLTDSRVRDAVGINDKEFVFASTGIEPVRAGTALDVVKYQANLKYPERILATNLRKHTATISQVMGLESNELHWLVNHLGHSEKVHLQHYRATSGLIERIDIAKLMLLQEKNIVGKFAGMKLNEIDFEELDGEPVQTTSSQGSVDMNINNDANCFVALNFQTGGEEMQLLHGKFLDNGNSGYTLKPQCFKSDADFEAVLGSKPSKTKKRLNIKVISGFCLPKPKDSKKGEIIDPFLKIEIHGVQRDKQDQKTSVIKNNGFNPVWNEGFTFDVDVPELALVRFAVYDSDRYIDDFIGYCVVPFNSMVQGYRHFPLFDKNGDQFEQGLMLVHVEIMDQPQSNEQ